MTTRREFLKSCGCAAAAAVIPPSLPPASPPKAVDVFSREWARGLGLRELPYLPLGSTDWWVGHYPDSRIVVWKPIDVSTPVPQPRADADWQETNQLFWTKQQKLVTELGKIVERRVHWRRLSMPWQPYRFISGLTVEVNEKLDRWKMYCHLSPGEISAAELADIGPIACAQHRMLREQWNVDETRYPLDPFGPTTS